MAISRQQPRRRGDRPVMYGRDRERAQLRELLMDATASDGSLVLISGETGIGKTTLVDDLMHAAEQRDYLVLSGGCYDLTTTPPYAPWSEALRGYHPEGAMPALPRWFDNPEELEKIGSQTAFFEETRRLFTSIAAHQPLLIVLEDLHWADAASLEALRYLARSLGDAPTLLVVTYRDDEITRRHELYQLLPILVRESRPPRIHLSPLARHDVWDMVTGRYNLSAAEIERLVLHLSTRSQGNPFFVEEILQGLRDDRVLQPVTGGWKLGDLEQSQFPSLLRQALDVRLARLSQETRDALRIAAVIGQIVPLDLWQTLSGREDEDFERSVVEALDAYVLQESATGEHLQFRHALLREALHDSLSPTQRRAKHRAVGAALATIPNADPDAVAHHFQQAGDRRAAHWWVSAGVRAHDSYALRVAADCYTLAQAALEADPDAAQTRGWLLVHLGHLMRNLDPERGTVYVEEAALVARRIGDPLLTAYSQYIHGVLRCHQDDIGTGLQAMGRAHASWELVTASQKQQVHHAIASLFPSEMLATPRGARGNFDPIFRVARTPDINPITDNYVTFLATTGRFREAIRVGVPFVEHVAAATYEPQLIQELCAVAYQGLAVADDWLGQPERARRWRAKALEAFRAIGYLVSSRHIHFHELTSILTYQTDQVELRQRVVADLLATAELPGSTLFGHPLETLKLNVDLLEGCWETARAMVDESFGAHDHFARFIRTRAYRVLGREQDDEHFAAVVWADIYAALPDGPATEPGQADHEFGIVALQSAADLTLDAGDLKGAREWIGAHDRWIEWSESVLGRAQAQLLWTRYHHVSGDLERAQQHVRQALEHASDPRQPLALIAAHRALGQLGAATDRFDQAREHLQASLELAERCEAPYERALTTLELADLAAHCGDINEALRLLEEVQAICESLGAQRTQDQAASVATEIQAQPQAATSPFGLTPRELEVLQVVAEGLTDAEAGQQLSISTRTVSHHLRSIYSKLEINNRAAAVRIAMEHELV